MNVILRMVVGKRYFGVGAAVGEEEGAQRCQKAIGEFFRLLGLFVVNGGIPFLGWLDIGGHEKAMKKTAKEMDGIAQEWLEEHRRRKDRDGNNVMLDFMDVLLSALDDNPLPDYDADTINKATSMVLQSKGGRRISNYPGLE